MTLHFKHTLTALLTAATLMFSAAASLADDHPQLLLKPDNDDHELSHDEPLPRMGFYSQFVFGRGAYVTGVRHGTEAARLGLEEGDTIVGINGQKLQSPGDWNEILHDIVFHHDDFGAQQSGKPQLLLKPEPQHEHVINLHIRDWRTGDVYLRKTNLKHWD